MTMIQSKDYPAPRPSAMTRAMRTFIPWQLIRFLVINIRMMIMISKSHGRRADQKPEN